MSKFQIPILHSFRTNNFFSPNLQSFKSSCQNFLSLFTRFISTSSPDSLEGLIDPDLSLPGIDLSVQDNLRVESASAEEFSFLRESLLESGAESSLSGSGKCLNDALSILNVIRNNSDGFGDKTQKFLTQFREILNESLVVDVLNHIKNAELGVKFFIWAGRHNGYSHSLPVYNALLDVLRCDKNHGAPHQFLREIKDDDKEVIGKLLNVLIGKCCRNGLWNIALEQLRRLKYFGYKPSKITYDVLIQVFLEADRLDTAYLVHREMSDSGLTMDENTLGCFVYSLCKVGRWKEALDLIEKEGFVPNTVLYTQIISGLCEASLFDEAMDFLNRMRSNSCIPDVVTYRSLLSGCLEKRKLHRCKRILSMMIEEGCYPRPKIFNSLVHAYCRSGDYAYAYMLLKKMVCCGYQPGYGVYNALIGGICGNAKLPNLDAVQFAEKAYSEMLDAGVVLHKVNISNFARCLCGAGKFENAYNVIREMMSKGFIPDVITYSKVMNFLCKASRVDKAILLFQEMKKNNIVPNVYTYTILIDSFCKIGLIQQARNWFDEMLRDGCAPNVVTYTALIHSYLKVRKLSNANELFEMMLSEGCIPDAVTFNALVDGHCKAGEVEKACKIYAKMRGSGEVTDADMYFRVDDSNARKVDAVTCGALIDGLCKQHRVEEAYKILDGMLAEGCEPDLIAYNALIDGFCKVGKLDDAHQVFAKMLDRGYSPCVYTYSSWIDRLCKDKRFDLALKVLSKMLESGCAPNVIIYTQMMNGLCKVGKTDEANKLMLMMEEKGCLPNVVTYTVMIDGFGKAGKVDKCLELLRQMGANGCAPNYVTYKVLIYHCSAAGLLDEAYQLLEEMKHTCWPRDMASYHKVVEGFNREFIANLGLLDEISENDSTPLVPVYRLLIDSFRKAERLEIALQLLKEISSSSLFSSTDQTMYSSLIESLSISHKVDKAFELYINMIWRGGVPELSVFFNLIKGLIKVNRWEEALQLSYGLCYMDIHWLLYEETSDDK